MLLLRSVSNTTHEYTFYILKILLLVRNLSLSFPFTLPLSPSILMTFYIHLFPQNTNVN